MVPRGVITNRESDFNIFTGEPRGTSATRWHVAESLAVSVDVDEQRRSLNMPSTRMYWSGRAGEAAKGLSAIDAALENAKSLRLQQQHLLADEAGVPRDAGADVPGSAVVDLKRQRDEVVLCGACRFAKCLQLQRRQANQNLTSDDKARCVAPHPH